ncbi:MAG: ABC transporter substrate-binding protein [Nitrososphaeraceae archaeon]
MKTAKMKSSSNPRTRNPRIAKGIVVMMVAVFIISSTSLFSPVTCRNDVFAQGASAPKKVLRIAYFPNVNHAQAVIGFGTDEFKKQLGDNVDVQTFTFNAGPSAIEALLAKRIDATYVGSNPAINGYIVSGGKDLRIISGAASGGAVLVVRNDSGINSPKDFAGKKFASPQLGNTQDVALRKYLLDHGYKTIENGGNVTVVPVSNADTLTLFLKKQIDGAWVPEPWGARLVKEGGGKILLDERTLWPQGKFVTNNIVVRTDYLQGNPDVIKKLLAANVNETLWINGHRQEAAKLLNEGIKKITGKAIPEDELKASLSRIDFTYDPLKLELLRSANNAFDVGYLGKQRPDLSGIFDTNLLDEVLKEKGLQPLEQSANETANSFGAVQ